MLAIQAADCARAQPNFCRPLNRHFRTPYACSKKPRSPSAARHPIRIGALGARRCRKEAGGADLVEGRIPRYADAGGLVVS